MGRRLLQQTFLQVRTAMLCSVVLWAISVSCSALDGA